MHSVSAVCVYNLIDNKYQLTVVDRDVICQLNVTEVTKDMTIGVEFPCRCFGKPDCFTLPVADYNSISNTLMAAILILTLLVVLFGWLTVRKIKKQKVN